MTLLTALTPEGQVLGYYVTEGRMSVEPSPDASEASSPRNIEAERREIDDMRAQYRAACAVPYCLSANTEEPGW
jgi:hypothetical protein